MRFEKGQSGNPAGRPPGSRNKATVLAETMFQGEAETIIRMAIDKAKEGDMMAIRLCLERVFPKLRDRATLFDLPPINNAREALDALTSIVEGVRGGEITAAEGCELSKLISLPAGARGQGLRAPAQHARSRIPEAWRQPRRCVLGRPPAHPPPVLFPVINRKNRRFVSHQKGAVHVQRFPENDGGPPT
jgi:hypothetical protein